MSNTNEASYDKIADNFVERRMERGVDELVVKFEGLLNQGEEVLDIGCGGGVPNAKDLSDKGFRVTGIDISTELLERAKENVPNAEFKKANILEYESGKQFKGVLAWDSLFHLKPDEHEKAFRKIVSLLMPDGYLLFTHGAPEGEIESEMYGERFSYSSIGEEKMKKVLSDLGFNILDWKIDESEPGYVTVLAQKIS